MDFFMGKVFDLRGQTFWRLTVLEIERKTGVTFYKCICKCGKEKVVRAGNLKSGNVKSCGCYQKEFARKSHTTHGMSKTRFFIIHMSMLARCSQKKRKDYGSYGG